MPKKKRPSKLSLGELRLMGLLWQNGPLTLAEAHQAQPGQLGYTTIQTQLNRLVKKGAASRSRTRPMKYRALIDPETVGDSLLQLLIETIGRGSILPLVEQLISCVTLSIDDVRSLKRLVDDASPKKAKANRNRKKTTSKRA